MEAQWALGVVGDDSATVAAASLAKEAVAVAKARLSAATFFTLRADEAAWADTVDGHLGLAVGALLSAVATLVAAHAREPSLCDAKAVLLEVSRAASVVRLCRKNAYLARVEPAGTYVPVDKRAQELFESFLGLAALARRGLAGADTSGTITHR